MILIHQPGDPQARPPYVGEKVLLQAGFIRGDASKLQAVIDAGLNSVGQHTTFRVVSPHVLFAALYAERMRSTHPEDARFGSVPESDIGLWALTLGGPEGRAPALRWTPLFLFVDSATALMTGRELYGYPKQLGRMLRATGGARDFSLSLRAVAFQRQDPSEIGAEHEVLRATPAWPADNAQPRTLAEGAWDPWGVLDLPSMDGAELGEARAPAPFLGMPMVFVRQFRDVRAVDEARLQQVVAVTVRPTKVRSIEPAPPHTVSFNALASCPIVEVLGLGSANTPLEAPFVADFDFEVGTGEVLTESQGSSSTAPPLSALTGWPGQTPVSAKPAAQAGRESADPGAAPGPPL